MTMTSPFGGRTTGAVDRLDRVSRKFSLLIKSTSTRSRWWRATV